MSAIHINLPPLTEPLLRVLLDWWDNRATKQDIAALRLELMATLEEVLAKVEANNTILGSLNTLLDGLRQQVQEILSGALVPAAVQQKIDTLFQKVSAQGDELTEVLLENTPQQPPTTP